MDYAETCYIITGICIVISIIFSALTKYIDNKNKSSTKKKLINYNILLMKFWMKNQKKLKNL